MTDQQPEPDDLEQRLERFRQRQDGGPVRILQEPVGGPIPEGRPADEDDQD